MAATATYSANHANCPETKDDILGYHILRNPAFKGRFLLLLFIRSVQVMGLQASQDLLEPFPLAMSVKTSDTRKTEGEVSVFLMNLKKGRCPLISPDSFHPEFPDGHRIVFR
jgi:hypothetical protein